MSKYVLFCEGDVTKRAENVEINGKRVRSGLTVLRRRCDQTAMKLAKQRYSQRFSGANSYFPPKFGNWFPLQFATRSFRGFLQKTGFSEKKNNQVKIFLTRNNHVSGEKKDGRKRIFTKINFLIISSFAKGILVNTSFSLTLKTQK